MASSRQLPVSYNESTYNSAGGADYTSLATWEAATDNDLVTATNGEVLTCAAGVHNDTVALDGATTNANYFRVIRAASGQRGTKTSGVRFEVSGSYGSGLIILAVAEAYGQIQDVACKGVNTSSGNYTIMVHIKGAENKVVGVTVYDSSANNGTCNGILTNPTGTATITTYIINCFADNADTTTSATCGGIRCSSGSGRNLTTYLYNNTARNCKSGFYLFESGVTTVYSKNNIVQDNTTNITITGGVTHVQTTNATSGVTFDADGYHLDSTDTGARGNGTDLSADLIFAFDDDIDGDTRSAWDIGCDEFTAAVSSFIQKVVWFMQ